MRRHTVKLVKLKWTFLYMLIWAWIGCGLAPAIARTLYVSPTGSDGNVSGCPGTVNAENKNTPARLIQTVLESGCLQPGDTVRLLPGHYQTPSPRGGQTTMMYVHGIAGTASSPITIQADDPSNRPIIDPSSGSYIIWFCNAQYIILDGVIVDSVNIPYATYQLDFFSEAAQPGSGCNAQYIEVRNSEFRNTYDTGDGSSSYNIFAGDHNWVHHNVFHDLGTNTPYAWPTCWGPNGVGRCYAWYGGFDDGLFEYNEVYHTSGEAGQQSGGYGCTDLSKCHVGDRMVWRNNYFHDDCKFPLFASGADDVQIYNNIFSRIGYQNMGDSAVVINRFGGYDGYNTQFYSNTIVNSTLALGGALDLGRGRNAQVKNNIMWGNNADTIVNTNGATGYTLLSNLCTGGAGGCSTYSNPQLSGGCTGTMTCQPTDYKVTSGSPAINAGATLGSPWNVDYSGGSRPEAGGTVYDQGAWEFGAQVSNPTPGPFYMAIPTQAGGPGNDSNDCNAAQSITTPKATLASVIPCMMPGATLYIRGGTYNQSLSDTNIHIPGGASGQAWGGATTIAAYQQETPTFHPSFSTGQNLLQLTNPDQTYIIFSGLTLDASGAIKADKAAYVSGSANHIRLKNMVLLSGGSSTVWFEGNGNELLHSSIVADTSNNWGAVVLSGGAINSIIDGNDIRGYVGGAIADYNYSSTPVGNNNIIRNNTIHDPGGGNTEAGIIVVRATSSLAYNNVLHHGYRCYKTAGTTNAKFYNNTCASNTYGMYIDSDVNTVQIVNNIIDSPAGNPGISDLSTGANKTNNVCASATTGCNVAGTLAFNNPTAGDYSILANSVAVEAGTTITQVTTDILGISRPQQANYDVGAYEYVPGPGPQAGVIIRTRPYSVTGAFTTR